MQGASKSIDSDLGSPSAHYSRGVSVYTSERLYKRAKAVPNLEQSGYIISKISVTKEGYELSQIEVPSRGPTFSFVA